MLAIPIRAILFMEITSLNMIDFTTKIAAKMIKKNISNVFLIGIN
jgi:hypothetical protein